MIFPGLLKRVLVLLLVGVGALAARADVIVLKNGRRIQAWAVEEQGDRVYYETPNGRIGIPKRLVERIERGDTPMPWSPSGVSPAADLPEPDLPALNDADVLRVIADGKVDRTLLGDFEAEARRSDSEQARLRAAAAHVLVGRLQASQGKTTEATRSLRRALVFAPKHPALLLNLAALEVEQQRYEAALEHLRPVVAEEEYAFEAYRLQGWIYYRMEEMDRARTAWKRALAERPDSQVEALLERLEQETQAAEGYGQRASGRFVLRYSEEQMRTPRLESSILRALDSMYDEMASAFNLLPRQPIVVLLYSNETFHELTGMPPWVHGVYDGKIRLPVQGLVSLDARLEQVLRHELVHAFVFYKSRGRAPRWLQEGLAQWYAGQRPWVSRETFRPLFEPRDGAALARIEAAFRGAAGQVMGAYMASWWVVATLEQQYGSADMESFLEALARGESVSQALRSAFRLTHEDLERSVYDTLR